MNKTENIREFKQLESAIAEGEADIEAKRWRQAELAAIAVADGMSRVEYGQQVGKSDQTISMFVRVWQRWGASGRGRRPRFADAMATIKAGSDEIVTKAEQTQREKERQVPTRHEDKVEMAEKLLADPAVAKAAVKTALGSSVRASNAIQSVMYDYNADKRKKQHARAEQRRQDNAVPLPAMWARISTKMTDWAFELAGIRPYVGELPEGSYGREAVAKAAEDLADQAQKLAAELRSQPELRVVEGTAKRVPRTAALSA